MADDVLGSLRVNVSADLSDLQSELDKIPSLVSESVSSISSASASVTAEPFEDFAARMHTAGTEASKELEQLAEAEKNTGEAGKEAAPGLEQFYEAVASLGEGLIGLLEKLFVAVTVFEILKESFAAFSEAQDITTSFTLLSGSADTATVAMERLKEMATATAVSESEMLEAASKLAPQFGVGTQALYDALQAAADAAAGAHKNFDSVAQAIDRIAVSGQVGTRQLMQFGISIDYIAEHMGTSAAAAKKMLADTTEGAMDATQKVQLIIDTIEEKFPGAAALIATNLSGQFNALKNGLHQLAEDIGTAMAPLAESVMSGLREIEPTLKGIALGIGPAAAGFKELADAVVSLVPDFLKVIASGPAMISLGTAIGFTAQAGKVLVDVLHAAALMTADFVSSLNPFGDGLKHLTDDFNQAGIAITKDFAGFGDIAKLGDAAAASIKNVGKANEEAAPSADKHATATSGLSKALKDAEANLTEVSKAFKLGVANADDMKEAQDRVAAALKALNPQLTSIFTLTKDSNKLWADSKGLMLGESNTIDDLTSKQYIHTASIEAHSAALQTRARLWEIDMADIQAEGAALAGNTDRTNVSIATLRGLDNVLKMVHTSMKDEEKAIRDNTEAIGGPFDDALILGINDGSRLQVRMDEVHAAFLRATSAVDDQGRALYSIHQQRVAEVSDLEAQIRAMQNAGENTTMLQLKSDGLRDALQRQQQGWTDLDVIMKKSGDDIGFIFKDIFTGDFSMILTDLKNLGADLALVFDPKVLHDIRDAINRDLSTALKDLILGIGDVGAAFKKLGTDVLDIILNKIIALGIQKMFDLLAGLGGVLGSIGTALGGVAGGVAGAAGQVAATTANTTAITANTAAIGALTSAMGGGSVASAAGGATGGGGGIGSALGGLTGAVTAISTAISAVTGVIGVFQSAHQETSLNAIESNTRVGALYTLAVQQWVQGIAEWNGNNLFPELQGISTVLYKMWDVLNNVSATLTNIFIDVADLDAHLQSLPQALQGVFQSVTGHVYLDGQELFSSFVTYLTQAGIKMPQS